MKRYEFKFMVELAEVFKMASLDVGTLLSLAQDSRNRAINPRLVEGNGPHALVNLRPPVSLGGRLITCKKILPEA